jgi:hypothetical protein
MRDKRGWMALFVALVVLAIAPAAWSAPKGENALVVHVVAVKSDEALDQAEALTTALKKAVIHSSGWSLGESEQALEFLALKLECASIDTTCEAKIAEVLKADRFLWAEIAFDPKDKSKVVGTLAFYVKGQPTKKVSFTYPANYTDPNSDWLIDEAKKIVNDVTGGAPAGNLKVMTGGVAGQIVIDGQDMGALPAAGKTFELKSGPHQVLVKAPGYEDAEGTATVKPSTTVELTLGMVAIEKAPPPDFRLIGGIAALTIGVAAGAVGLWSSLEVNGIDQDEEWQAFTASVPQDLDACQQARDGRAGIDFAKQFEADRQKFVDMCDDAATFEVLQAVMYPIAAVSAGVGIFLIGTSNFATGEEGDAGAITIQPVISPELGAVAIGYTF